MIRVVSDAVNGGIRNPRTVMRENTDIHD
jgi:hypothetical protein